MKAQFIKASTKQGFLNKKSEIPETSIVFIEDKEQIYTQGKYYQAVPEPSANKTLFTNTNGDIVWDNIKYTVKSTVNNCTFSESISEVNYGDSYNNTLSLEADYELLSLKVTMGGVDITDTCWKDSTISIESVTGNIYIDGVASNGYTITQNIQNVTSTNSVSSVTKNAAFTTILSPKEGYSITSVTVLMGGADITSTVFSKNVITIDSVTANVIINVATALQTFTITQGNLEGVTCEASATVAYNQTAKIIVTLQDSYAIDSSVISITQDGINKEFTLEDNVIIIPNVTGNIIYNIKAFAVFSITYILNNVTSSNEDIAVPSTEAFTTTLSYDTDTYNSIIVTVVMGQEDITLSSYNSKTNVISISQLTGDITITAEASKKVFLNYETTIDLMKQEWKFNKLREVSTETFDETLLAADYDDSSWTSITLPYDWSIYNSFDTSTTGNEYESGWLSGGDAIYRTTVTIPSDYSGKKIYIHFDGVYMTSEVFVNGTSVGTNKNGYIPFNFDITNQVKYGESNSIAVAVSHRVPNSRWYSRAGIYRDCWISMENSDILEQYDITVTAPDLASEHNGTVTTNIEFSSTSLDSTDVVFTEISATVYQEWDGTLVGTSTNTNTTVKASSEFSVSLDVGVPKPTLWTTHNVSDTPRLYQVIVTLKYTKDNIPYVVTTSPEVFGYRYISYDSTGFYLNGTKTFLKGMCLHHDNGILGAETYKDATERELRILKNCGCNCIRATHNPQSKTFLEQAMRQGFMVIEELFDGWRYSKNSNTYDYARFFSKGDEYIEVVVENVIKRDKNNPAIIMWSLGNEVDEGCSTSLNSQYVTDATTINTFVKKYDTTRPTTIGNNKPANTYAMQIMALVDIAGVNYGDDSEYSTLRNASSGTTSFSTKCIYGSETTSPFYTRGIYTTDTSKNYYSCFDYSNSESTSSHATWGDSSCVALKRHTETYTWLTGIMPWTGFDYIGEPTPVNNKWVRSSYFGIVDLCGLPKDAYYLYQAKWTSSPMIHIVPEDWSTWTVGSSVAVWVYSNCASVKLHLNGTEIEATSTPSTGSHYAYEYSVTYSTGTLVATGYNTSEEIVAQDICYSAGNAAQIGLYSDKTQVDKDGLLYIECNIEDQYSTLVPNASNKVTFTCTNGEIVGTDNGFEGCLEDMRNSVQSCFTGKCVAIIKPNDGAAEVVVTAVADGLTDGVITVLVGASNVYKTDSISFIDPTNPPVNADISDITFSASSVHFENGSSATVTATKVPSTSKKEFVISSCSDGFTATIDTDGVITITNTTNDIKGQVTVQCGGISRMFNVSCGSAESATCTMLIDGEENSSIYVGEYLPLTFTTTDSVSSIEIIAGNANLAYNSYGMLYGSAEGSAKLQVTLKEGEIYYYTISVETWSGNSKTISTEKISSCYSQYYTPSITTYTTSTAMSGSIALQSTDSSVTYFVGIIDVAPSVTVTSTTTASFGYDSTGLRKAYVIIFSGTAGAFLYHTFGITDSENGLHTLNVRGLNSSCSFSYKIGTLACTTIEIDTDTISITSDSENNKSIKYTVLPEGTTDTLSITSTNNYVTVSANGDLFAIKNGTDTITFACGDITKTVTVNISNITEDETLLAYNANISAISQYYAGGSTGVSWDSTYTLFAEMKVSTDLAESANIISIGANIDTWKGCHFHIYYPATTQDASSGGISDKTTKGICIAMANSSSSSPTTLGVTTTMKGGQELDTIYIVMNSNGLWINGTNATKYAKTTTSFSSIMALSSLQIGSLEGNARFSGIIKSIRRLKTTDLATTYQSTGLTATELEDISNNGLDTTKYLALYETSAAAKSVSEETNEEAFIVTEEYLSNLEVGTTVPLLLVNPQKNNGYILGYNIATLGYSKSTLNNAKGFGSLSEMSVQVNEVLNSEDANDFVFFLTKVSDFSYTLSLSSGESPIGDTDKVTWGTAVINYSIDADTEISTSVCEGYDTKYGIRLKNESGYYLSAQGSPSNLKFTDNKSEWSLWCAYKVNM